MSDQRPGRNEPCPCGSGKKYKQCCLAKDEALARDARAQQEAAAPAEAPAPAEPVHAGGKPVPSRARASQPWKRGAGVSGGAPKFNIPRRSGGS